MKRKYKALMLDLDGTTIPNDVNGRPSKKVKEAIEKARNKIHIGVATSRPYFMVEHIVKELALSGPSIIQDGAQVINVTTGEVYFERDISKETIQSVYAIAKQMNVSLWIDEETATVPANEENIHYPRLGAVVYNIPTEKEADEFIKALAFIKEISTHKFRTQKNKVAFDGFDIGIAPASATKQNALYEVAKVLGITTREIIGVGDGYNDFPLLMACGLKVAMENAVDELKKIADYIAPSVENDGVADVIEKFIL